MGRALNTGPVDVPGLLGVPLLAWLACGLAAVSLSPRNLAAGALAATGVLWPTSWQLEHAGYQAWADLTFLVGLAGVVGLLLVFPTGRFVATWHRHVAVGFLVAAVAGPLASRSSVDAVAAAGEAVVLSEPAWVLVAVALLVLRFVTGTPADRRDLAPVLAGTGFLASLLVVIVATSVSGIGVPGFVGEATFIPALAVLPVVLLWGISRRARVLDRELAASRTRLSEAEDGVRRRIERDLHDGVQQQLVAILSLTELATRQVTRNPDAATGTLGDVRDQVSTAITDLRELVHGIRPPVLEDAGVAAALASRLPPIVSLRSNPGARDEGRLRWPPEIEAAAYFVVCEAVSNAVKHARDAEVEIDVHEGAAELSVRVADRGPGGAGIRATGGLAGLQDRVESLGGRFEVGPGSSGGTEVRATFVRELLP